MKKNKHKNKLKKSAKKRALKKRVIRKVKISRKKKRNKISKKFVKIKIKKPCLPAGRRKKIIFSEADLIAFVEKGRVRGFVTEDEILRAIPNIEDNIGLVEELYEKLAASNVEIKSGQEFLLLPQEEDEKKARKLKSEKSKKGKKL